MKRAATSPINGSPKRATSNAVRSFASHVEELDHSRVVAALPSRSGTRVTSMEDYRALYRESVSNPLGFWSRMASESLSFSRPYDAVMRGSMQDGSAAWFTGGRLNASYNCLDRHLDSRGEQAALIWEGDDPSHVRTLTYRELHAEVCRLANALRRRGVRKGDHVAICLPMVPELPIAMLACARIGAPHVVVFAGFSAESLRQRINDTRAKVLITADRGTRGGKKVPLRPLVDEALRGCSPPVETVLCLRDNGLHDSDTEYVRPAGRDEDLKEAIRVERPYAPCEDMDSEDPLFVLHTSGSTGKPKGLVHSTAGYLLYAATTCKFTFDLQPGDVHACVADVGWITGHSYVVFGPLCNGATTLMFESVPTFPTPSRYWDLIDRHRVTQFYTAPTAVRALMRFGDDPVKASRLDSLRVLGVVGEPINPSAWKWLHEVVGRGRVPVIDTYWQTETGGHIITPLPFCTPLKPGSATLPFFGIVPVLINPESKQPLPPHSASNAGEVSGHLCLSQPWPGMARTVLGDHTRFLDTYLRQYPGHYFTGDGCTRDADGYHWITGRVDDVINKAGHRLGSAEIESALVAHPACSEAAVIAVPDEVFGEKIVAYCTIVHGHTSPSNEDTRAALRASVRALIGPIASPDLIVLTPALPKTRSGKIMRRVLRKLLEPDGVQQLGDTSTLADPGVIDELLVAIEAAIQKK